MSETLQELKAVKVAARIERDELDAFHERQMKLEASDVAQSREIGLLKQRLDEICAYVGIPKNSVSASRPSADTAGLHGPGNYHA